MPRLHVCGPGMLWGQLLNTLSIDGHHNHLHVLLIEIQRFLRILAANTTLSSLALPQRCPAHAVYSFARLVVTMSP